MVYVVIRPSCKSLSSLELGDLSKILLLASEQKMEYSTHILYENTGAVILLICLFILAAVIGVQLFPVMFYML